MSFITSFVTAPNFWALLFWHMPIWKYLVHFCWCEYHWNSAGDPCLLLLHSILHFPYAFRGGEMQSILHLCISPDSHHPVLFHLHLYLSETYFQLLFESGQSGFCILHRVIPMLNLLIYSLRNKKVKKVLWNVITRKTVPSPLKLFGEFSALKRVHWNLES